MPARHLRRWIAQAKAILTFVDAISEKTLRTTVALTAARGRGKSAALGLAIAAAVAYGYVRRHFGGWRRISQSLLTTTAAAAAGRLHGHPIATPTSL